MVKLKNILVRFILYSAIVPHQVKAFCLHFVGVQVGTGAHFMRKIVAQSANFSVVNHSYLNFGVFLYPGILEGSITIGDDVQIGPNSSIICVTHDYEDSSRRAGDKHYRDIIIEDGVWVAANVTVLPGVCITHGCVIAAGSVVTKDTEPNSLYAGVPAKLIKRL